MKNEGAGLFVRADAPHAGYLTVHPAGDAQAVGVDVPDARDGEAGLLCCTAEADVTHAADGGIEVADGD